MPLHVAFLWHMHQPQYRNMLTGSCPLPWVRLHASKGYADVAAIAESYPQARHNVNLVPCLLRQLRDAAQGASDDFLDLSERPADELSEDESARLLRGFFMANWQTMVEPYPRYRDLLDARGRHADSDSIAAAARRFRPRDIRDLQVWFNLAWFGFDARARHERITELIAKGRDFTEEEKAEVLAIQRQVIGEVIDRYKGLQEAGSVELTTTPFYHPILPLICDTDAAREAMPNAPLPQKRFQRPEDAAEQVARAVAFHTEVFGAPPRGMWPAEGSVSQAVLPIIEEAGLAWLASDEGVLARSETADGAPSSRYRAYAVGEAGKLAMVFRDRGLSDLIGFSYSRTDPHLAARDMINRLEAIADAEKADDAIACIILDGENPWEYYADGGKGFLTALAEGLVASTKLTSCRIGDFVAEHPPRARISRLFAGSWIATDFHIWIGDAEDNRAWDMLQRTREVFQSAVSTDPPPPPDAVESAKQSLLAAEGSDWFWWFGEHYSSDSDEIFDTTFRGHLAAAYGALGIKQPSFLSAPVMRRIAPAASLEPLALVQPVLDGRPTHYYEWVSAGRFETSRASGAMQTSEAILQTLYFGFDLERLYLRVDSHDAPAALAADGLAGVMILLGTEDEVEVIVPLGGGAVAVRSRRDGGNWEERPETGEAVADRVVEAAVPFSTLGVKPGEQVCFVWAFRRGDVELERWPRGGYLRFACPTPEYELEHWQA